jgi:hypothetical protein
LLPVSADDFTRRIGRVPCRSEKLHDVARHRYFANLLQLC